jgi:NAD(P)-dependent dehydrogenase (short-subunit alcohol dehydrogenase family)
MLALSAQKIHETTGASEAEARATLAAMNPMKRLIQPAEVAEMVAYLASEAASVVTGQALGIDAGEVL